MCVRDSCVWNENPIGGDLPVWPFMPCLDYCSTYVGHSWKVWIGLNGILWSNCYSNIWILQSGWILESLHKWNPTKHLLHISMEFNLIKMHNMEVYEKFSELGSPFVQYMWLQKDLRISLRLLSTSLFVKLGASTEKSMGVILYIDWVVEEGMWS